MHCLVARYTEIPSHATQSFLVVLKAPVLRSFCCLSRITIETLVHFVASNIDTGTCGVFQGFKRGQRGLYAAAAPLSAVDDWMELKLGQKKVKKNNLCV